MGHSVPFFVSGGVVIFVTLIAFGVKQEESSQEYDREANRDAGGVADIVADRESGTANRAAGL